jgi:hypothetical protein
MLIAVVAVPVVFPDGGLPDPRWLAWCTTAVVTFLFRGNVLSPHAQHGPARPLA